MTNFYVAPLVGAWIEIFTKYENAVNMKVAPLVGAWIEITKIGLFDDYIYSRSSCRSVD